jgi:NADH:ubiquinone oxidoreductase subunit E
VLEPNPPKATPARDRVRPRSALKGRQPDPAVVTELQGWLGEPPPRERLIEALHVIQDRLGALPAPHLVALASWMKLAPAEVYEVASFYHHFDVIHEDAAGLLPKVPGLIVRVCTSLPCQMAGSAELLARLPALLGAGVRVLPTPCVGRCDQAPVAVVHQHPVPRADTAQVQATNRPARPGRRGLPGRAQVAHRARRAGAAADGGEHRRRRTRHLQGPRAARTRPAPFSGRHADRRLGGGHRRIYIYLRDEYHGCRALLQAELAKLRATRRWPPAAQITCAAAPAPTSAAKSPR